MLPPGKRTVPGTRAKNCFVVPPKVQKGGALSFCSSCGAGRGPRALPPLLGRCLPFACRRGFQPVAPFSVPVDADVLLRRQCRNHRCCAPPGRPQRLYYSMGQRGVSMQSRGKSDDFPRLFREIPVSLPLFLGQLRVDDVAPVQIAAFQALDQDLRRGDIAGEGDIVGVAQAGDIVDVVGEGIAAGILE